MFHFYVNGEKAETIMGADAGKLEKCFERLDPDGSRRGKKKGGKGGNKRGGKKKPVAE